MIVFMRQLKLPASAFSLATNTLLKTSYYILKKLF